MKCIICSEEKDLRSGICFDCLDAGHIIETGLDMYDKSMNEDGSRVKGSLNILKFLVEKGWKINKPLLNV